jgi:predicted ATPase
MQFVKYLQVSGWKSIVDQSLELRALNALVGPNGSGKSNLLAIFRLINELVGGRLQQHLAQLGGPIDLLHHGESQADRMELILQLSTDTGESCWRGCWIMTPQGRMLFAEEEISFCRHGHDVPYARALGTGHHESRLPEIAERGDQTARVILNLLSRSRYYNFHDASERATMRGPCFVDAHRFLFPDGRNVAALLERYRVSQPEVFERIQTAVRTAYPHIESLLLEPTTNPPRCLLLCWKRRDRSCIYGPLQLSDGALRFIALATLLLQPENELPLLIVLDEPELGLDPRATDVLSRMIAHAVQHCQILLATHSAVLIDSISPDDVVVVEDGGNGSRFQRMDAESLDHWLNRYSLEIPKPDPPNFGLV